MKESTTTTVLMKAMPRALWKSAMAKARKEQPPVSMKWLVVRLLQQYLNPKGENR